MATEESSSSSEDEVDGPLEKAASAGAHLQFPEKAAIARTRNAQSNAAQMQRGMLWETDPKASAGDRVHEHRYEYLIVVGGNLRFNACK